MKQVLHIVGPLDFDTVPGVFRDTAKQIQEAGDIEINCSGVTQCNTAALALFIGWIQQAQKNGVKLTFSGIPERLLKISDTCRIRQIFGGYL